MKFVVDASLGGLARWLRFGGFDAQVERLSSATLPAPAPGTFILTRQSALARLNRPDLLVVAANAPEAQLAEVLKKLKISREQLNPLSRCSRCNAPLLPTSRTQVQGLVPEHVFLTQKEFYQCPQCGRLFWPGSHLEKIVKKLEEALGGGG